MRRIAIAGASLLAAVCALPVGAQTYKCKQPDGGVSYQEAPCAQGTTEMPPPETDAHALMPSSEARAPNLDSMQVFMLVTAQKLCEIGVPGYKERSARAYTAWRTVRAEQARQAEELFKSQSGPGSEQARLGGKSGPPLSPLEKAQLQKQCGDDFIDALARMSRAPDPRYSSPRKTWDLFIGALRRADRAVALSCMSDRFRTGSDKRLAGMSDDEVRGLAAAFKDLVDIKLEKYSDEKEFTRATAVALRNTGPNFEVRFEREIGEWKIDFM